MYGAEGSLIHTGGSLAHSCRVIELFTVAIGMKTLLFPEYWSVRCTICLSARDISLFLSYVSWIFSWLIHAQFIIFEVTF